MGNAELVAVYLDSLRREIRACEVLRGLRLESVFFGGGTPSLLGARQLEGILKEIADVADISKAEVSLEVNPGTGVNIMKFCALRGIGFNRVSLGLQAAQDKLLAALGRTHTNADFLRALDEVRGAGFSNISVDIMFGLPQQASEQLEQTICQITCLGVQHVSAYALSIENGTLFGCDVRAGALVVPDEDTQLAMYHQVRRRLAEAGYLQYEISNFSQDGYRCRHNMLYWTRQNYLGFGLGAHSLVDNQRWHNTCSMSEYLAHGGCAQHKELITLGSALQMEEYIFLGLRLTEGISATDFAHCFGVGLHKRYGAQIAKHVGLKTLAAEGDNIRLTPEGVCVSNIVLADFLADSDSD